jgi:transcriptional regulator with GAF, ATPase, and Fis domain
MRNVSCWLHAVDGASAPRRDDLTKSLAKRGVKVEPRDSDALGNFGVCTFGANTTEITDFLRRATKGGEDRVIAVADPCGSLDTGGCWRLLQAGASDVLINPDNDQTAQEIKSRFERWQCVDQLMKEPSISDLFVAKSHLSRAIVRDIVEIARFSTANTLILGETGTGKEIIAKLIHLVDSRPDKRDLVILDCSTIMPELSGSEFFGHERGAFTGAITERHGAFALANGGTLFLDEIGELPLPLQAQLLRVVQEGAYKRVGGSTWRRSEFRLVCATNRDLCDLVRKGEFRADLYYRIAGFVTRLLPLRERHEDIIPLAEHFLRQARPNSAVLELDEAVRDYLLHREYPGNVRDLQQAVLRLTYRHAGQRSLSIGCIPPEERPVCDAGEDGWMDLHFEGPIKRAVRLGAGLKEIGRAAEDVAIRCVTDEEEGNLQRAARRLGVTDRALQLRRANGRPIDRGLLAKRTDHHFRD